MTVITLSWPNFTEPLGKVYSAFVCSEDVPPDVDAMKWSLIQTDAAKPVSVISGTKERDGYGVRDLTGTTVNCEVYRSRR